MVRAAVTIQPKYTIVENYNNPTLKTPFRSVPVSSRNEDQFQEMTLVSRNDKKRHEETKINLWRNDLERRPFQGSESGLHYFCMLAPVRT